MSMYRIEMIQANRRTDGDESDLPWQPVTLPANVDASDLGAICRYIEDLEFCDEGLRYRYVPVPEEFDYVDHYIERECKWVKIATPVSARRVA